MIKVDNSRQKNIADTQITAVNKYITESWEAPDGFKYMRKPGCPLVDEI